MAGVSHHCDAVLPGKGTLSSLSPLCGNFPDSPHFRRGQQAIHSKKSLYLFSFHVLLSTDYLFGSLLLILASLGFYL